MTDVRLFDLNIETILEAWDNSHAVRELIANALDEQVLTGTPEVEIAKDRAGDWSIRDWGRGLRYEHFTQNENPEKLEAAGRVIGKFVVLLVIAPPSQELEPPTNPGRFTPQFVSASCQTSTCFERRASS